MKILVIISRAWLGGHVLSAFTTARYLQKAGHEIVFAGGSDKMTTVIEEKFRFIDVPIPIYHGSRESYFTWKSFHAVAALKEIILSEEIDIIHAFDARAYVHASIAALQADKPATCTLCGGIDPFYNIPLTKNIAVFSDEQKAKMVEQYHWPAASVSVIRNRVEMDLSESAHPDYPDFFMDVELDPELPTIMMISSFDSSKKDSIIQVFEAFQLLIEQGHEMQLVFIGGKGAFFSDMVARGKELNARIRRKAVVFTGPVYKAYKLLQNGTIVIGVGRSAFEGMVYGKPTVVVGMNGYAGLVCKETIPDLAYYNFSGRNQQKMVAAPEELASVLRTVLEDKEVNRKCSRAGQNFVMGEIDVAKGIPRIQTLYDNNLIPATRRFRLKQWGSIIKIMVPIWRDNWWHTIGMPLKRLLGRKVILDDQV